MIELDSSAAKGAKIRVIGVGGGGGNAINNMINRGLVGVDFIAANTDKQALDHNLAQIKVHIGKETTRGLGAGSDPEIGRISVEESYDEIKECLRGSDMIFVTCGMGGGTGTGGAPLVAQIGQELGALIVSIVTKPFSWEGKKRARVAEAGIVEIRKNVDALIVIPNEKLLGIIERNTNFGEAFQKVDEVLYNATRGIADIISQHGVVNVDFADVKTVMKGMGDAIMGIGISSGENRAVVATENALNSPLLDGITISGSQGVLVNVTGGSDLTMHEVAEAVSLVEQAAGNEANLIHGVVYKSEPSEEISVTVVATGFNREEKSETVEKAQFFKPREVELPFREHVFERSNSFRPPVFGGAGRIEVQSGFSTGRAATEVLSKPKGPNELKHYDAPAYERRLKRETLGILSSTLGKMERGAGNSDSEEELREIKQKNDKPAFLRKIMD